MRKVSVNRQCSLPCSTASTVRSSPPARQSPPAQTPAQAGLAVGVGGDAPALQHQAGIGQHGVAQLLADGLEHHVGLNGLGFAGRDQLAHCKGLVAKRTALTWASAPLLVPTISTGAIQW
jgi:hypothetical protein